MVEVDTDRWSKTICPRPHDRINGLVALRELTFMLETVGSTQYAKRAWVR